MAEPLRRTRPDGHLLLVEAGRARVRLQRLGGWSRPASSGATIAASDPCRAGPGPSRGGVGRHQSRPPNLTFPPRSSPGIRPATGDGREAPLSMDDGLVPLQLLAVRDAVEPHDPVPDRVQDPRVHTRWLPARQRSERRWTPVTSSRAPTLTELGPRPPLLPARNCASVAAAVHADRSRGGGWSRGQESVPSGPVEASLVVSHSCLRFRASAT